MSINCYSLGCFLDTYRFRNQNLPLFPLCVLYTLSLHCDIFKGLRNVCVNSTSSLYISHDFQGLIIMVALFRFFCRLFESVYSVVFQNVSDLSCQGNWSASFLFSLSTALLLPLCRGVTSAALNFGELPVSEFFVPF